MLSSPISSRKTVPPAAASNTPRRDDTAPVKAPRSWPKSSLSRSCGGMAPQSTTRKGLSRRGLPLWIASAETSLPVPVSPLEEDRGLAAGGLAEHVEHRLHGGGVSDHATEAGRAHDRAWPPPRRGSIPSRRRDALTLRRAPHAPPAARFPRLSTSTDVIGSLTTNDRRARWDVTRHPTSWRGGPHWVAASVAAPSRPGSGCVTTKVGMPSTSVCSRPLRSKASRKPPLWR